DKHRTKGLICKEKEIELDKTTNLYRFIASIQEEVHNYAITYHTECSVKVDESLGYGIVSENNNKKAIYLAVIDAVLHSNNSKFD
ncbi:excinuclease ABC subunit UvrC, partial [Clostridioides difficile]